MTMLRSGQPADYRDDELELADDDPEPDLLDDLDEWVVDWPASPGDHDGRCLSATVPTTTAGHP